MIDALAKVKNAATHRARTIRSKNRAVDERWSGPDAAHHQPMTTGMTRAATGLHHHHLWRLITMGAQYSTNIILRAGMYHHMAGHAHRATASSPGAILARTNADRSADGHNVTAARIAARAAESRKNPRARESTKRSKTTEVVSDSLDESDDQPRSPVRRTRPNVKHTARTSSPSVSQRAPSVAPDDDTGVDVLRTPKERGAPSARGEDTAAKRNLDFSDTGDASETEQADSQEDTEFPFKDVIRLIARKSEADIKDVQTKAQKRKLTLLSDENTEEPADYAALTTASGIVAGVDAWFEEFFDRDVTNTKGKAVRYKDMFRSKVLRPALKTYKEGDTRIRLAALDKPKKSYSWLPTPSKRHSISDQDLQVLLATVAQAGCSKEGLCSSFQKRRGARQAHHADRDMPGGSRY